MMEEKVAQGQKSLMGALKLMVADFMVSCLWIVSGALVRVITSFLVSHVLHLNGNGELLKCVLTVIAMFIFSWIGKLTNATYNPITLLLNAFGSSKHESFFVLLTARILSQALGSLVGVMCVMHMMPYGARAGPMLRVGVKSGMVTEAILTFTIAMVALIVNARGPKSFFLKTWMVNLSKLSLSILGADLTGPAMNPASAFGWAYARNQLITKEHLYVYWLAPLEACLLAVFIFRLLTIQSEKEKTKQKTKSIKKD